MKKEIISNNNVQIALIKSCQLLIFSKIIKRVKVISLMLIVLLLSRYGNAQSNWVNATVASTNYSGSPSSFGVTYVSNDVDRTVTTVGSNQYVSYFSATAWDTQSNAYVGWSYDDGYAHVFDGVITISTHTGGHHVYHPDVVVIKRSATVYYIVVTSFNASGSGVYADWYKLTLTSNLPSAPTLTWDSPAWATLSTATMSQSYTVNLDVSQGNKLVAVWTENVSGTLQVKAKTAKFVSGTLTWSSNTFTMPTFTYGGSNYTAPFKDADVAVLEKYNGDNVATFCMIKTDGTIYDKLVITNDINFTDIEAGTTFTSLAAYEVINYASTATITSPRIDRQRQTGTSDQTGWTVVFRKYTFGFTAFSDICGITTFYDPNHSPAFYSKKGVLNYTDGTAAFWGTNGSNKLLDINDEFSSYPVVSYEKRSGDIDPNLSTCMVIGFGHNNGSDVVPLAFYAQYEGGEPYSKASPNQQYKFYAVPYNPSGDENYLAVSGTESRYFMYSWINWNSPYAIEYKYVDSKEPLRFNNSQNAVSTNAIVFSQNYAVPFSMPTDFKRIQLYSTSGSLVADKHQDEDWMDDLSKLNNGLYIAMFSKDDGNIVARKIIISK